MTAKEYLSQAWKIDRMVNAKLEQVQSLRELATKATSTLSPVPPNGTRNIHRMEDIIAKMIDLEAEINSDIDRLVDKKREIMHVIRNIENPDYQTLLEYRYLCFMSWGEIATDMHYNKGYIFELHNRALENIKT